MTELQRVWEQLGAVTQQHLPSDVVTNAAWGAGLMLLLGIGISVFGAKLARFGLTSFFVLLGGALGAHVAQLIDLPVVPSLAIGAATLGVIGFISYRFVVGLMVAGVIAALVAGAFSYARVLPHVSTFDAPALASATPGAEGGEFTLLTPEAQQAYRDRTPEEWFSDFWAHVGQIDATTPRYVQALAICGGLAGLLLGLLLSRAAVIVAAAVIGTAFVTSSLAMLATRFAPGAYEAGFGHPMVVAVAGGAFLVASLIVQTLVTREAPKDGEGRPARSA